MTVVMTSDDACEVIRILRAVADQFILLSKRRDQKVRSHLRYCKRHASDANITAKWPRKLRFQIGIISRMCPASTAKLVRLRMSATTPQ
jgi:hypothetical protein